jgi:hypothetical protein
MYSFEEPYWSYYVTITAMNFFDELALIVMLLVTRHPRAETHARSASQGMFEVTNLQVLLSRAIKKLQSIQFTSLLLGYNIIK